MVMQPIHDGLPSKALYSGAQFQTVSICLDSGKLATAACSADARGIARVTTVNVYPEDVPTETCDKHVTVDYCVTGGGVATPLCSLFPDAQVETRSLVKMTPAEVEEIRAAMNAGLKSEYYQDGYVYYVDEDGNPLPWHGFRNDNNLDADTPYIVCPIHNQQAFDSMEPTGGNSDGNDNWGVGDSGNMGGTDNNFGNFGNNGNNEEDPW